MSAVDRLARIADAHVRAIFEGGLFDDVCMECHLPWPCPTYVWATTERSPTFDPWDPADDEPEGEA